MITDKKIFDAITYFEEAIEESDEIIDECSDDLKAELTRQMVHFEVALVGLRFMVVCRESKRKE